MYRPWNDLNQCEKCVKIECLLVFHFPLILRLQFQSQKVQTIQHKKIHPWGHINAILGLMDQILVLSSKNLFFTPYLALVKVIPRPKYHLKGSILVFLVLSKVLVYGHVFSKVCWSFLCYLGTQTLAGAKKSFLRCNQ